MVALPKPRRTLIIQRKAQGKVFFCVFGPLRQVLVACLKRWGGPASLERSSSTGCTDVQPMVQYRER